MAWMATLTDPETELGFKLVGMETFSAKDAAGAQEVLQELMKRKESGILMINEDFLPSFPEKLQKQIEESFKPVIFPIPHIRSWEEGERKEDYLAGLLRKIIGYQIKIKR